MMFSMSFLSSAEFIEEHWFVIQAVDFTVSQDIYSSFSIRSSESPL